MNNLLARTNFVKLFSNNDKLILDNKESLSDVKVAYQSYGRLNKFKDNVIMINHALTGNAHAAGIIDDKEIEFCSDEKYLTKYNLMNIGKEGWWAPLIGEGKVFDLNKYFVICSNILGSCYGTLGPTSIDPITQKEFRLNFPQITVRDIVKVQKKLLDELGINRIKLAIGGSLGGMQVIEWAIMYPEMIEKIIPIATTVGHSPWAIGLNEASRNAIQNDSAWNNGNYMTQPELGLSLARKLAMLTYRSYESFNKKFGRAKANDNNLFAVESYLNYQGEKLIKRFDANTYLYLSKAMDLHDVGYKRGGASKALEQIKAKTLCVGINSDILYPVEEQKEIAKSITGAEYSEIDSIHGHDAFLIEFSQLEKIIGNFLH